MHNWASVVNMHIGLGRICSDLMKPDIFVLYKSTNAIIGSALLVEEKGCRFKLAACCLFLGNALTLITFWVPCNCSSTFFTDLF